MMKWLDTVRMNYMIRSSQPEGNYMAIKSSNVKKLNLIVTGSKGTVGYTIKEFLNSLFNITEFDLPEDDVLDYDQLLTKTAYHDVLIHLAWDKSENYNTETASIDNIKMIQNVYHACLINKVKRVIFVSSVYVHDFATHTDNKHIDSNTPETPGCIYGISNWYGEKLGQYYCQKGMEIICIRLGGVIWNNVPSDDPNDQKVFLDRRDCAEMFKACILAPTVPNNFTTFYAVSNNKGRIHDFSNPFGWKPKYGWPQ